MNKMRRNFIEIRSSVPFYWFNGFGRIAMMSKSTFVIMHVPFPDAFIVRQLLKFRFTDSVNTKLIVFFCLFVLVNRFTWRFRCEKGYFGNPSKVGERCTKLPGT